MPIVEIKKYSVECSQCPTTTVVESKGIPNLPYGWKFVRYTTEGGGHYGFPHHSTELHLCSSCGKNYKLPDWILSGSIEDSKAAPSEDYEI